MVVALYLSYTNTWPASIPYPYHFQGEIFGQKSDLRVVNVNVDIFMCFGKVRIRTLSFLMLDTFRQYYRSFSRSSLKTYKASKYIHFSTYEFCLQPYQNVKQAWRCCHEEKYMVIKPMFRASCQQRSGIKIKKIPWRMAWQPTPVFLPGEFHGQRSLAGYSPQGHKESDMIEQ